MKTSPLHTNGFSRVALLFGYFLASTTAYPGTWPQWRGPNASGHFEGTGFPTEWNSKKNVVWKVEIPGRGHSSPVVEGDLVWLTTAYETPASEEDVKRRLKVNTGGQPLNLLAKVSLRAVQINPETGKILRDIEVFNKEKPQWVHKLNSYSSSTPCLKDGKLYCHFGAYGSACLDAKSGKIIWKNNDKRLWVMHENGPGSSPLLWGDLMIFHLDGSDKQSIVALKQETGEIVWQTKRSGKMNSNPQLKKSYATPILVKNKGSELLLSPAADWLYCYEPATGKEFWKLPYGLLGFSNVSRPVAGNGMVFLSTCFMKGEILGILLNGDKLPEIKWRARSAPKMPSPILVDDELYLVNDAGIASCLNAKTGELHWQERLHAEFSASPTYADGKIYFCDRNGVTHVVKPGKSLKVIAKNELDGTAHMASFAPYGKAFLIRTNEALYRVEAR
ncbi:PQQ-binding-like beta-propeller repeat protein [Opitutales bacterium]|jgi:outer membrane protein assembly factor BamB|nr:PQQ-binding-like beta-propeller repeat protein [Opitutales bacterium]